MHEYKSLLFKKELYGKGLEVIYHLNGKVYKVPHDKLIEALPLITGKDIRTTRSWEKYNSYSWTDYNVPQRILDALEPYRIK